MVTLAACGRLSFDARTDGNTNDVADVPNRMFLSQLATDGSFGSIAFADQACTDEATAAGLTGTFIAFVSDATTSARTRLDGSRGWVRIDGEPIGDTPASMFDDAALFHAVNQQADGVFVTAGSTWTGSDGKAVASANCTSWSSASAGQMGDGNGVLNATFSGGNLNSCDIKRRFTCAEIGHDVEVVPRATAGRHVFITSTSKTAIVGVNGANALCTADATAASLPGAYKAALATSTSRLSEQFPEDSRPWVTIAGTQIAAAGTLFTGTNPNDSFPNQQANGQYINIGVWTGVATTTNAASTLADTCQDWSSMAAGMSAGRGVVATSNRTTLWANAVSGCDNAYRVMCIEQ
jgi:hypothetical protein